MIFSSVIYFKLKHETQLVNKSIQNFDFLLHCIIFYVNKK